MTTNTKPNTFRSIMIGSICIALGQFLFATNDAIIKLSNLTVSQLLVGRSGTQLIIAIFWWSFFKPSGTKNWYGDKPYITNVWLRGVAYTIAIICIYYGVIRLPIGDAQCILNQSPLLTAIIATIFLKEKLPKMTPLIALFGIVGVLFLSQPTFITTFYQSHLQSEDTVDQRTQSEMLRIDGLIACLIAVIAWSICVVMVRTAKESHWLQLETVSAAQTMFIAVPLLLTINECTFRDERIGTFDLDLWKWDVISIGVMVAVGIIGFIALSLNVVGFQYAEASKVTWLEYIIIAIDFLYQIFLFDDIPNMFEITGAALVIIACGISVGEEIYNHCKSRRELELVSVVNVVPDTAEGETVIELEESIQDDEETIIIDSSICTN